jgi:predicted  nucleic acid-binding Zn-ribbon protein
VEQLDEARADLKGLTADLTKFEEMTRARTQAEAELRRQVKRGEAKLEQLVEARYRREGAESLLVEHRADIAAAQAEADRLEAQLDRAEKQAHLDKLNAEQAELASAWEAKAVAAGHSIVQALDDLYDIEREVCLTARAVIGAARAMGVNHSEVPPNFALTPWLLSGLPEGKHLGGGTIAFQPNRAYKVTLEPGIPLGAWRA